MTKREQYEYEQENGNNYMSLIENAILAQVRRNLSKKLDLDNIKEISAEGIKEHRDIPSVFIRTKSGVKLNKIKHIIEINNIIRGMKRRKEKT